MRYPPETACGFDICCTPNPSRRDWSEHARVASWLSADAAIQHRAPITALVAGGQDAGQRHELPLGLVPARRFGALLLARVAAAAAAPAVAGHLEVRAAPVIDPGAISATPPAAILVAGRIRQPWQSLDVAFDRNLALTVAAVERFAAETHRPRTAASAGAALVEVEQVHAPRPVVHEARSRVRASGAVAHTEVDEIRSVTSGSHASATRTASPRVSPDAPIPVQLRAEPPPNPGTSGTRSS